MHLTQQHQDITGQVSQGAVALLILAPAEIDLPPIERQSLGKPCSFWVIREQCLPLLFIRGSFLLEFINLSARAGLSTIEPAGVEEKWSPHLLAVFINSGCRQ